ncbi:protein-tyrosine-phosphatase [Rhabdobacter roseus]|uniref:Arsenate reductase n=1 Tax=Rhabdobacter roseus TaxID=1655419 RepID=A0A840TYL1_9BACT|nr:protein-tyrosine-phosphatase [Rhabdobacter roseus]MBB5286702.1 arsenate reductase [Rhabdobacter roseus]
MSLLPSIRTYFESLDVSTLSDERRAVLAPLTKYLQEKIDRAEPVQLTFICTHNSRRSHLGQVWAQVAAHYYQVPAVRCYSGGTETTACNPRTVVALERAGLAVRRTSEGENPTYEMRYAEAAPPMVAFSKVYDEVPNPTAHFAAIMTCSQAEQNCPFIPGAERRIPVMYQDPKEADDTPAESTIYDARCRQIATEMKYVFAQAAL